MTQIDLGTVAMKFGGTALVSAVLAILGIKKIIKSEICEGLKPTISSIHKDITQLQDDVKETLTEDKHKLICKLTSELVEQKFNAITDVINIRFEEQNRLMSGLKEYNGHN